MTDHQHAATGPDPGSGPRASGGTGPRDAAPAADSARAHGQAGARKEGGAAAPPPEPAGETGPTDADRFRRDRRHKMLGGVCAGLGRQCDMDPVIFRITLAVLSATGGIGLIFYGFAWLFVPYDDEEENEIRRLLTGRVDGHTLTAVLFALVGCGVFLTMLSNDGVLSFAVILSLLLAGAGYWSRRRGAPSPDHIAAQAVADAPPEPQAPPVPASFSSWWREPIVKDGTHIGGTGYLWGPRDSGDPDIAAAVNISLGTRGHPYAPPPRPPKPRGPRRIGGRIFLLALLAGGLGTGLTWEEHPLGTSLQTGLACALAVFGIGVAVSAFLGRTGAGSIVLAVITAGLLAGSAAVPKDIGTDWKRTTWEPASVAQIRPAYELGTGNGVLDLSAIRVPGDGTVATRADVGLGRIHVIVPRDVTVKLSIDVGVGDIQLPGDGQKDVDVAPGKHEELTLEPPAGAEEAGTLDLELQVGAGQAEVSRATS
ncbi:PspC domain-containing protein [Streptomyces capillispiralis]|uniref:Phage shock protein C (PspC) family protein n=1 Tax=Streptomyces capillispiralis TaxID=68182 RepID=A0A561TF15_9ACTN|nr:PspC domain-containing protein [Streptomyces capillispiralis]TWF85708.1 phage shock protein C (PspC) family protein [Streptomyces capillispiralis]GHH89874.1 membrane protein [Streptomyces capillispiralis]